MKKIPLTQGLFALVDDEDFVHFSQWIWQATKIRNKYYATRRIRISRGKYKTIYMHREIVNAPKGVEVDHRNGDGLNNRRHNLRHSTRQQNSMNQRLRVDNISGHAGVTWHKKRGRWRAIISINKKPVFLGYFDDKDIAIEVRKDAEKIHYGEFAPQN